MRYSRAAGRLANGSGTKRSRGQLRPAAGSRAPRPRRRCTARRARRPGPGCSSRVEDVDPRVRRAAGRWGRAPARAPAARRRRRRRRWWPRSGRRALMSAAAPGAQPSPARSRRRAPRRRRTSTAQGVRLASAGSAPSSRSMRGDQLQHGHVVLRIAQPRPGPAGSPVASRPSEHQPRARRAAARTAPRPTTSKLRRRRLQRPGRPRRAA